MRFEVPVSEVDLGDEIDQLLVDYLGLPIHPPTEAKGILQPSMASTNSASEVLSEIPSHDPLLRSTRRSATARSVPADVGRATSDASSATDLSIIPFENALTAFKNHRQNSQIESPFYILPGDLSNLGRSLLPSNMSNPGTRIVSIPGYHEHDQYGVAAKEEPKNYDECLPKVKRRLKLGMMRVKRPLDEIQEEDQSSSKIDDHDSEKEIFHDSKTTLDSTDTAIPVKPLRPRAVTFDLTEPPFSASSRNPPGETVEAMPRSPRLEDNPFTKTNPTAESIEAFFADRPIAIPTTATVATETTRQINPPTKLVVTTPDNETAAMITELKAYEDSRCCRNLPMSPSPSTPIETPLSAQTPDSLAVNLPKSSALATLGEHPQISNNESLEVSNMELLEELNDKLSDLRTASFLRSKMVEAKQQVKLDALQRENSNLLEEKSQARQEIDRLKARVAEIEQETQADKQKILQVEKLLQEVSIHVTNVKSPFPNMPFYNNQETTLNERLDAMDSAFDERLDALKVPSKLGMMFTDGRTCKKLRDSEKTEKKDIPRTRSL